MNSADVLTLPEAYDAMFAFLTAYWERGGKSSDDLAVLLGSMNRTVDGQPLDPAQWYDWERAAAKIKEKKMY